MKIVFFDEFTLGVLKGDAVVDVSRVVQDIPHLGPQDIIRGVIERWGEFRPRLEAAAAQERGVPLDRVKIRPPLPKPTNIVCMAVNYMEDGTRSEPAPINAFLKSASAIIGDGDTMVLPDVPATIFEGEAEMAVIIGKRASHVSAANAMSYVFGYTNFIDGSARGLLPPGNTFYQMKSRDTFAPLGPWLVTADEIADPHQRQIRLSVNGTVKQNFNANDMAHKIPRCIEWVTSIHALEPGDVLATGTNHRGLSAFQDGDRIEVETEGLGRLHFNIRDALKRTWDRETRLDRQQKGQEGCVRYPHHAPPDRDAAAAWSELQAEVDAGGRAARNPPGDIARNSGDDDSQRTLTPSDRAAAAGRSPARRPQTGSPHAQDACDALLDFSLKSPRAAWRFGLELVAEADDSQLSWVGIGILEYLLVHCEPLLSRLVLEELGRNSRFRAALAHRSPSFARSEAAANERRSDGDASLGELALEVERARADRLAVGHRPEQLELEPVGILRVEREAHAVIRLTHEGAGLDQREARPREVGEILHLPCRVVHARGALVGLAQSRLLEQPEVVIVAAPRDPHERGLRITMRDLEAEHVAVEALAAPYVGDPEHEMLQPPDAQAAHGASVLATSAIDGGVAVSFQPASRR
jgi:2-keto-4-pentenoate hydratase/2-oxohepta-3-ene-1,7-dioic acid hydratase in catechol pathway